MATPTSTEKRRKDGQNFTVNLDQSTHRRLKLQAVEERRPMTDIIRDAVRTYLDVFAEGVARS